MANDQLEVAEVKAETADDDGHVGELIASFQSFFASSTFSDLTIITKDQEFKVHKLIVCSQSGFFARLFKQNWKEAEENVVRLNEDDPRAVEAMVHFMYGFNYNNSGSEHGRVSPMLLNVKVYQVADKYDIPKLKAQAKENFTVAINKCWEMDDFPTAIEDAYSTTTSGIEAFEILLSAYHQNISMSCWRMRILRKSYATLLASPLILCRKTQKNKLTGTQKESNIGVLSVLKSFASWHSQFPYIAPYAEKARVTGHLLLDRPLRCLVHSQIQLPMGSALRTISRNSPPQ
ncbi:hypothetical protein DTO217A2_3760 [Paecilomyces variotii]|nr:hypothetical protein DTO217A2_3760 [Paecilomyces variotii]